MTLAPTNHRYPEDVTGKVIQIGDVIAYAVAVNSSGVLNIGKVVDMPIHEESRTEMGPRDAAGRNTWIRTVGTYNKLKLQPWDINNDKPETESEWDNVSQKSLPTDKPVGKRTIQYSNRAVVIGN